MRGLLIVAALLVLMAATCGSAAAADPTTTRVIGADVVRSEARLTLNIYYETNTDVYVTTTVKPLIGVPYTTTLKKPCGRYTFTSPAVPGQRYTLVLTNSAKTVTYGSKAVMIGPITSYRAGKNPV